MKCDIFFINIYREICISYGGKRETHPKCDITEGQTVLNAFYLKELNNQLILMHIIAKGVSSTHFLKRRLVGLSSKYNTLGFIRRKPLRSRVAQLVER